MVDSILDNIKKTGVANVKDFGAIGDGETDDTKAIQTAIDYCFAGDTNPIVFFPSGNYVITQSLVIAGGTAEGLCRFEEGSPIVIGRREPSYNFKSDVLPEQLIRATHDPDSAWAVVDSVGEATAFLTNDPILDRPDGNKHQYIQRIRLTEGYKGKSYGGYDSLKDKGIFDVNSNFFDVDGNFDKSIDTTFINSPQGYGSSIYVATPLEGIFTFTRGAKTVFTESFVFPPGDGTLLANVGFNSVGTDTHTWYIKILKPQDSNLDTNKLPFMPISKIISENDANTHETKVTIELKVSYHFSIEGIDIIKGMAIVVKGPSHNRHFAPTLKGVGSHTIIRNCEPSGAYNFAYGQYPTIQVMQVQKFRIEDLCVYGGWVKEPNPNKPGKIQNKTQTIIDPQNPSETIAVNIPCPNTGIKIGDFVIGNTGDCVIQNVDFSANGIGLHLTNTYTNEIRDCKYWLSGGKHGAVKSKDKDGKLFTQGAVLADGMQVNETYVHNLYATDNETEGGAAIRWDTLSDSNNVLIEGGSYQTSLIDLRNVMYGNIFAVMFEDGYIKITESSYVQINATGASITLGNKISTGSCDGVFCFNTLGKSFYADENNTGCGAINSRFEQSYHNNSRFPIDIGVKCIFSSPEDSKGYMFERIGALGRWTPPTYNDNNYNADNFKANTGLIWTVTKEHVETYDYTLIGNTVVFNWKINDSLLSGTGNELRLTIPGIFTNDGRKTTGYFRATKNLDVPFLYCENGGEYKMGCAQVQANESRIVLLKQDRGNWNHWLTTRFREILGLPLHSITLSGSITFEVKYVEPAPRINFPEEATIQPSVPPRLREPRPGSEIGISTAMTVLPGFANAQRRATQQNPDRQGASSSSTVFNNWRGGISSSSKAIIPTNSNAEKVSANYK